MVDSSPVSRRIRSPSWLDLRLVAGIALVLACVLVGVRVVASADRTERFWAAGHQLAAGEVLQANDLRSVAVRLPSEARGYFPASADLIGMAVNRDVGAGELVPRAAIGATPAATTVTIPLGADNAPKISAGQRITVWVSTSQCPSVAVIAGVAVQSVQSAQGGSLGGSGGEDVTVRLSPDLAQRVIEALALDGGVLRAGVVDGNAPTGTALPELTSCAGNS